MIVTSMKSDWLVLTLTSSWSVVWCLQAQNVNFQRDSQVPVGLRSKRMSIRMGKSLQDSDRDDAVPGKLETPYLMLKLILSKASNDLDSAGSLLDGLPKATLIGTAPVNLSRIEEVGRFFRGGIPIGTDLLNRYFIFRYVEHGGTDRWTTAHEERQHRGSGSPAHTGSYHAPHGEDTHKQHSRLSSTTVRPVSSNTTTNSHVAPTSSRTPTVTDTVVPFPRSMLQENVVQLEDEHAQHLR